MLSRSPDPRSTGMTAKEMFVEAMRRSDADDREGFVALQAPDCQWTTPNGELHGRDEIRAWLEPWFNGFPNERRHELGRVVEIDGTVYAEGYFRGRNDGAIESPQGVMPATG